MPVAQLVERRPTRLTEGGGRGFDSRQARADVQT